MKGGAVIWPIIVGLKLLNDKTAGDTLPNYRVYSLTGSLNSRANLDDFRQFYADKSVYMAFLSNESNLLVISAKKYIEMMCIINVYLNFTFFMTFMYIRVPPYLLKNQVWEILCSRLFQKPFSFVILSLQSNDYGLNYRSPFHPILADPL